MTFNMTFLAVHFAEIVSVVSFCWYGFYDVIITWPHIVHPRFHSMELVQEFQTINIVSFSLLWYMCEKLSTNQVAI